MLTALLFFFYGVTFNVVVQAITLLFLLFSSITSHLFVSIVMLSFCVSLFSVFIEFSVEHRLKVNRLFQRYLAHKNQIEKEFSGKVRVVYSIGLMKVFRSGFLFELLQNSSLFFKVFLFIPAFIFLNEDVQKHLKGISGDFVFGIDPFSVYAVHGIHVLPVLMFVLSILSGLVYLAKKEQLMKHIVLSLLFLVLLYPSKSILVIYWCCNITFSTLILSVWKRKAL